MYNKVQNKCVYIITCRVTAKYSVVSIDLRLILVVGSSYGTRDKVPIDDSTEDFRV